MQFGLLAIIIIIMRIILLCVYYSAFPQASLFSAAAQISVVGEGTEESCLNPAAVQMLLLSPVVSTPESPLGSVGMHAPPARMKCSHARGFLTEDSLSKGRALGTCRTWQGSKGVSWSDASPLGLCLCLGPHLGCLPSPLTLVISHPSASSVNRG